MDTYPCPVHVLWIRWDMLPAHTAGDRARHRDLPLPLPLLPVSTVEELLGKRGTPRHATRGTYLPSGLARWEGVVLRGLPVEVALSPAAAHAWPARYHAPFADTWPFCLLPASEAAV